MTCNCRSWGNWQRRWPSHFSITFEKSRQFSRVPTDWKRGNVTPIFEKRKKKKRKQTGNYRPVSLSMVPRNVMEQIFLETIQRHVEMKMDWWQQTQLLYMYIVSDKSVVLSQWDYSICGWGKNKWCPPAGLKPAAHKAKHILGSKSNMASRSRAGTVWRRVALQPIWRKKYIYIKGNFRNVTRYSLQIIHSK